MNKKYDIAVVPGRFQPIHNGHLPLFKKAFEIADEVIGIIGSANMPRMPKNPFTEHERQYMISESLLEVGLRVPHFAPIEDSVYLDQTWYRRVKEHVGLLESEIREKKYYASEGKRLSLIKQIQNLGIDVNNESEVDLHLHLHGTKTEVGQLLAEYRNLLKSIETVNVAIVGHKKDKSTAYLNGFANWTIIDVGKSVSDAKHDYPISATEIRELWFNKQLSFVKGNVPNAVYKFLTEFDDAEYFKLIDEHKYVIDYKKANQNNEYETQFMTADAVVMHGDEILTIVRGTYPGKGLRALPGGFKKASETFLECCLRELVEETGLKVPEKVLRGSIVEEKIFDDPNRSSRGTTVTKAFLIVLDPTQPRPRVTGLDDADKAEFVPLADFFKMRNQLMEDHYDIALYMTSRS